jgi:hypothetical protein
VEPTVLASLGDQPVAVGVRDGAVYVAMLLQGIAKVPVAGGALVPLVAPLGGETPRVYFQNAFVMDAENIYFSESSGGYSTGPIALAPLAGGAPVHLASSLGFTGAVAADATNVYWVDDDQGTVNAVPIAGGPSRVVASGLHTPDGIAVKGSTLYVTDAGGDLFAVPAAGGAVSTLVAGPGVPSGVFAAEYSAALAVDDEHVYFAACPAGGRGQPSLYQVPVAGGAPSVLAHSCATGIQIDQGNVYWVARDEGTVNRVPARGGPVQVLARDQVFPVGPAIDATHVYWGTTVVLGTCGHCPPVANPGSNSIMTIAK